jgi:hypothetical protein
VTGWFGWVNGGFGFGGGAVGRLGGPRGRKLKGGGGASLWWRDQLDAQ